MGVKLKIQKPTGPQTLALKLPAQHSTAPQRGLARVETSSGGHEAHEPSVHMNEEGKKTKRKVEAKRKSESETVHAMQD
jgi:hypothetical protein